VEVARDDIREECERCAGARGAVQLVGLAGPFVSPRTAEVEVQVALARWLAAQPRREGGSPGRMTLSPLAQALAQLDRRQPQPEPADA
jgi:hypothetical protein